MLPDDAVADPQAEAGSFLDTLGGEERLENPADIILLNARPVVGDRRTRVGSLV